MSRPSKSLLSLSLLALVPVLVLGWLDYRHSSARSLDHARGKLEAFAALAGQQLSYQVKERHNALQRLAADRQLVDALSSHSPGARDAAVAALAALRQGLAEHGLSGEIALRDTRGELLGTITTSSTGRAQDGNDAELLDHTRELDFFPAPTGEAQLVQRAPIRQQQRVLAYLELRSAVGELLNALPLGDGLGRTGTLFLRRAQAGGMPSLLPVAGESAAAEAGSAPAAQAEPGLGPAVVVQASEPNPRGPRVLSASWEVPALDLGIVAQQDMAVAPPRDVLVHLAAALGLGGVLWAFAAVYFARRIVSPLHSLSQLVTGGGPALPRRLPERAAVPELSIIAKAFNRMLDQIGERQKALEHEVALRSEAQDKTRLLAAQHNEAQSEFLANVSHELRTPMNAILGISTLMSGTPLDGRQQEFLGVIRQSAQSLLGVLNNILDMSRLRAGTLSLSPCRFDLHELLQELAEEFRPAAQGKGLQLHYQWPINLPRWVVADPVRLRQILWQLLENAIKFTERGAVVLALDARPIDESHCELELCVSDSGIGIPLHKQQGIFDAFSQIDRGTKRRYGGTGLGLSLAAQLAGLMRGRVWLRSRVGEGSSFHVAVPVNLNAEPAPALHGSSWRAAANTSISAMQQQVVDDDLAAVPLAILIAEDNVGNQRVLEELLSARGHRLTMVDNGLAAVRAFRDGHFDQILMDVQMPLMDGLEAAEKIREIEGKTGHPIPIIALTAHALRGDEQRCFAAGMSQYLAKPINPTLLIQKIEGRRVSVINSGTLRLSANEDDSSTMMVLDKVRLNDITRNNPALLRSLAQLFLNELPDMLKDIEDAAANDDSEGLAQSVHRLKSALGNFATGHFYQEIAELEGLAGAPSSAPWQTQWSSSRARLDQLTEELQQVAEL